MHPGSDHPQHPGNDHPQHPGSDHPQHPSSHLSTLAVSTLSANIELDRLAWCNVLKKAGQLDEASKDHQMLIATIYTQTNQLIRVLGRRYYSLCLYSLGLCLSCNGLCLSCNGLHLSCNGLCLSCNGLCLL